MPKYPLQKFATLFYIPLALCVIFIFDLFAYLLPTTPLTRSFYFYKKEFNNPHFTRRSPKGLYQAHKFRGMDLVPNLINFNYALSDNSFFVQTNELSCFDHLGLNSIKNLKNFDYFAGDSFTFGHIPLSDNFPSKYEKSANKWALKCGVSHTGQRHQFSKFKEITGQLNKYPQNVFVGFFVNDPANDHAFPHSTVLEGFEVDVKGVDLRNELVEKDLETIKRQINEWKNNSILFRSKQWLRKHSLTFNLSEYFFVTKSIYRLQNLYNLHNNFIHNPITLANREALLKWKEDSQQNHYKLIILLIPDKAQLNKGNPFIEMEEFLKLNQIIYVNVWSEFKKTNKDLRSYYLKEDAHLNAEGASIIAEVLASRFK